MTDRRTDSDIQTAKIIQQLEKLPLAQPPADMTNRIMTGISQKQQGPASLFWNFLSTPFTLSMRPVSAIAISLVIAGVFSLGRYTAPSPEQTDHSKSPSKPAVFATLETAQSNYLLGRGLLLEKQQDIALPLLKKAASLEPDNPEYAFWEGIGYWSVGNHEQERNSYLKGLQSQPDSIPLMTNLGHTYLGEGSYDLALSAYHAVLEQEPDHAVALYNSGLIFRKMQQVQNEIETWRRYLVHHRTGQKAFKAVERLNGYGNYSYRAYQIGARKVIISPESLFDPARSMSERSDELRPVAAILEKNKHLQLEIVVFADQAPERARHRAHIIKQLLTSTSAEEIGSRIGLSWLGCPQPVTVSDNTTMELPEGLLVFSRDQSHKKEEV